MTQAPREYVIERHETDFWSADEKIRVIWKNTHILTTTNREEAYKVLRERQKKDVKREEGKPLRYTLLNVYCDGDERL